MFELEALVRYPGTGVQQAVGNANLGLGREVTAGERDLAGIPVQITVETTGLDEISEGGLIGKEEKRAKGS